MDKLRIACIGAGSTSGARSSGFFEVINQLHDLYDQCAIMDLNEAHARAAADQFGIPEVYTSLDALFEKGKPDVVVRLTPTDSTTAVCVIGSPP